MAMCADTDDAYFYEWTCVYSEGLQPRDPVRPQPGITFPSVELRDVDPYAPGFGTTPPVVDTIGPENGALVIFGDEIDLLCNYSVLGHAARSVNFIVIRSDGKVTTNDAGSEFVYSYTAPPVSGIYTWAVEVIDEEGRTTTSSSRTIHVVPEPFAPLGILAVLACVISRVFAAGEERW